MQLQNEYIAKTVVMSTVCSCKKVLKMHAVTGYATFGLLSKAVTYPKN